MSINARFTKEGDWERTPYHRFHWESIAERFAQDVTPDLEAVLKEECPKRPAWDHPERGAPGAMAASIDSEHETTADSLTIDFAAHTDYAGYVVHGTRPHGIDPRVKRWLHWVDPGGEHFAKHVDHPGATADPFPDRVLENESRYIADKFARAVQEQLKE